MERVIGVTLSKLVDAKELKEFNGPAHRAVALQAAHYLGINTGLVSEGENHSSICIFGFVVVFRAALWPGHVLVEITDPIHESESISFVYKNPGDYKKLLDVFAKVCSINDTAEVQLLKRIQETMHETGTGVSLTYWKISEDLYAVETVISHLDTRDVNVRFYLRAPNSDPEADATSWAASITYSDKEFKNKSKLITAAEFFKRLLRLFMQMYGADIKSDSAD